MSVEVKDSYTQALNPLAIFWNYARQAASWGALRRSPNGLTPSLLIAASSLLVYSQRELIGLIGPNVAQDLNLNLSILSGVFASLAIIAAISTMLFGWVLDRIPRVPAFAALTAVTGLLGALLSRSENLGFYATTNIGSTMGLAGADVPQYSLLADWYPFQERGKVYAQQVLGLIASPLIGATLGGFLVVRFGWRSVVVMMALPIIAVGVISFLLLKEPIRGYWERKAMGLDEEAARRQDPPQSFGEGWRATFSVRMVRRLFVGDMFFIVGILAYQRYENFLLADQYGLDPQQRGLLVLPVILTATICTLMGGGLIDVLGRVAPNSVARVPAVFQAVSMLGLFGAALIPPLPILILCFIFTTAGLGLSGPGLGAIYSQVIPPAVRTQGLTVINLAIIPGSLALFVFGPLADNYGFTPVFMIAGVCCLMGALIILSAADFFDTDRRNMTLASTTIERARKLREEGDTKLLICKGVNVAYQGNQVLFGVDFEVEQGELIALLGTNGAGKSTLLRAISGTQEASDGAIIFDGLDITHKPPHEVAALGVVHMPGGRGVFPDLSVDENLVLATWMIDQAKRAQAVADAYRQFPRLETRKRTAGRLLSGGEQQMLALAMAFVSKPKLLMIDELSLGLAPAVVAELLEKVKEIHAQGTTVVVVEQSVNVALSLAKRAVFMEKGEIKFAGPTEDLLRRPDILRAVYVKGSTSLRSGGGVVDSAAARRRQEELRAARPLIDIQGVSKRFGGILALDNVDVQLREGEILGIVGPNGSGKTTLFDIISGYQDADSGHVWFDGHDITGLPPHERARLKLIRRFQDARLFPSLTVFESLLVALDQRMDIKNGAMVAMQLPAARRAERATRVRAERLIELLELEPYRDKFVKELSTGLRRIVDLAFVLAAEPKALLLDEPSSGIAQAEAEGLGPLLRRVRRETGCSILLIEHDIPLMRAVADELVAMVTGQVVVRGSHDEVLNNPTVVEAFMGGSEAALKRSGNLT